jgi:DNA invertase Pin-like site-specific DNA recombinase
VLAHPLDAAPGRVVVVVVGLVYPSTTWVKLKRQITVAGHVLVKEYKDDGHTRTLLDRPALNQLRADLKTDLFDAVHFLAADRIACAVAYNCIYCCVCLRRLLAHRVI